MRWTINPTCPFYFQIHSIAQTEAATKQVEDDEYEMSKPLARYVDDEDLEKMLKERTRDGDPMLMFTKKKKEKMAEVKKGKMAKCVLDCEQAYKIRASSACKL